MLDHSTQNLTGFNVLIPIHYFMYLFIIYSSSYTHLKQVKSSTGIESCMWTKRKTLSPISGTTPWDSKPQKWLPIRPNPVCTWSHTHTNARTHTHTHTRTHTHSTYTIKRKTKTSPTNNIKTKHALTNKLSRYSESAIVLNDCVGVCVLHACVNNYVCMHVYACRCVYIYACIWAWRIKVLCETETKETYQY